MCEPERRLAAILSADVVGYSRLMADDEDETVRTLRAYREEIELLLRQHHGRLVDFTGDNFLAEFASAVNGLTCAVEIQGALRARNATLLPERVMEFRMGLHLGEVRVEEDRLFGTGVNVAARLESLAEPGGVCLSAKVHGEVAGKTRFGFRDLGEQNLKNIAEPLHAYRVVGAREGGLTSRGRPVWPIAVSVAVLISIAASGWWLLQPDVAATVRDHDLPSSLVILPFDDMSPDGDQEYFAHGVSEELINALTRVPGLEVKGRTTGAVVKEMGLDVPQIGERVGVEAVIEGSVRKAGEQLRVTVQLISVVDGFHLWSETYDRKLTAEGIFSIQSEIATSVARTLRASLSPDEQRRLEIPPTKNLAAIDSYFLGKQLLEQRTPEALSAAVEYFKQVVKVDPEFALGHSGLADAYMVLPEYVPDADRQLTWKKSEAAAKQALALAPDLPEALASAGWNRLIHYYDWESAEALLRRALEVHDDHTGALHWLSHVLSWQGRHEEAISRARRAVEVDPLSRLMARNLSYILMDAGHYEASIGVAEDNMRRFSDLFEQHGDLWLTHLRAGRPEDAFETMLQWVALTRRDEEAAREVGRAFIRYHASGEPQLLPRELVDRVAFGSNHLGQVYAFLGDRESALGALEQAYEEGSGSRSVLSMHVNPAYVFIRDAPRFQAILTGIGLGD